MSDDSLDAQEEYPISQSEKELLEIIEKEVEKKYRKQPAKLRVAKELISLAKRGIKSKRGGLDTFYRYTGHTHGYINIWYQHARKVLQDFPTLAHIMRVKIQKQENTS